MIRVFPRKTKWTPIDKRAFVGDPPLFRPPEQPVRISATFTWDIPEAERLYRAWSGYYNDVKIGGPAYDNPGYEFVPGKFVKPGITITSRGCIRNCPWCFVPQREGWIRELPIKPGNDVADNNILACSDSHIMKVFSMLRSQKGVKFSGGLDALLLERWHVDLLKSISLKYAWFACDYPGAEWHLERVADLMSDFSIEKKRCYVLIGQKGETPKTAERRLETVYQMGFLPMAMFYRDREYRWTPKNWRKLQKKWSRPAIYKHAQKPAQVPHMGESEQRKLLETKGETGNPSTSGE